MINLEAFDPFLEHTANAELVEAKLYGLIVLSKDNTFSTAKIAQDELVKYEHVNFLDIEDDGLKERLVEEAHLQSISNPAWPIAKLIEW
jgi:hypothetical protein